MCHNEGVVDMALVLRSGLGWLGTMTSPGLGLHEGALDYSNVRWWFSLVGGQPKARYLQCNMWSCLCL